MITPVVDKDGTHSVQFEIREPLVYLDHWALRCISEVSERKQRFLGSFNTHETLFFSWVNAPEIAGNKGRSANQIREFPREIGLHGILDRL